jgi:SAM-dependent methyltransferase
MICQSCQGRANQAVGSKDGWDFTRCATCGTIVTTPTPTESELADFYRQYPSNEMYAKKRDKKIKRAKRRIKRMQRFSYGNRFLDVGCNLGYAVAAAQSLELSAYGIDLDASAVASAQREFGKASFSVITAPKFAAKGPKFDMVYTSEVIEHIPNYGEFAAAIGELTAPAGVLYLTTPDAGHFRIPGNFVAWPQVHPPRHLTYFTKIGLQRLFERYGFHEIRFIWNLKPNIRMIARKKI